MSTPIIEVQNFSYRYPRTSVPAIKDINVSITPGEFIGIVGPTGAGKTTLCLAMAGLIPQVGGGRVEGQILIAGQNSATVPLDELLFRVAEKKALVGITLQDPEGQLVGMTVEEDLAFGPENLGILSNEIEERIQDILKITRMEKFRFVFPYKLSGGQKQRVAIGSTLALRPQVLILDEPTSELDPVGRKEVFSLIKELKDQANLAIIVVEHHTEELARYCDRVLLMDKGTIVFQDSVENFFAQTELLRSTGVRPPDGVEFLTELRLAGIFDPPSGLVNEEEIVRYISNYIDGKK